MFKRSKKGRNLVKMLVIASSITAGLALAPNANAAINMNTTPIAVIDNRIELQVNGTNGWFVKPVSDSCNSTGAWDYSGNLIPHEFNTFYTNRLVWFERNAAERITHVSFSCTVTKLVKKVTYQMRWRSFTKTRSGVNTSSRSHSGRCYTVNSGSSLNLDCWGGAYAQGTYRFGLPSDARHIARRIETSQGCCYWLGGSTSKRWVGNTAIVRATGGRQIYVDRVRVTYQHRVRTKVVTWTTLHDIGTGDYYA